MTADAFSEVCGGAHGHKEPLGSDNSSGVRSTGTLDSGCDTEKSDSATCSDLMSAFSLTPVPDV
jgi:hypothetical protein